MRKLRVGIIDLVARKRERGLWSRVMNANFGSIMPQVLGVWCERQGHGVSYVCCIGEGDVADSVPGDLDIAFISAFTEAAHMAYALSAYLRSRGMVTAIGGPQLQPPNLALGDGHAITIALAPCGCRKPHPRT